MMRSMVIAAFLVVFGMVSGILNTSGILPMTAPEGAYSLLDSATITDITEGMTEGEFNLLGGLSSIGTAAGIIFGGIINALAFAPLLIAYGVPSWLAVALNAPVWFIYAVDVMNWFGNRQLT